MPTTVAFITSTDPPATTVLTTDFISDPTTRDTSAKSATGASVKCILRWPGVREEAREGDNKPNDPEVEADTGDTEVGLPQYDDNTARLTDCT